MSIEIIGSELPIVEEGEDIVNLIQDEIDFKERDILVISETIISRAKSRTRNLDEVDVSDEATKLANKSNKDPRICQLILDVSSKVIEADEGFVITEVNNLVCANAGIDKSNAREGNALLPLKNPDEVAEKLSNELGVGVIISDSVGRPFREGAIGLAIGVGGLEPFCSYVGKNDLFGREMETTVECVADELASAANLVLGESNQGVPVAIIRSFNYNGEPEEGTINRDPEESIFRE